MGQRGWHHVLGTVLPDVDPRASSDHVSHSCDFKSRTSCRRHPGRDGAVARCQTAGEDARSAGGNVNRSVLIVEDDQDTALLLAESLRRRGFKVEAVYSGEACLEFLQREHVDVVVTDVRMPGMNGIELCQHIRDTYPDVLPLVITGVGGIDMVIEAIRAGAYDYITKPVKV